jgi:hypothetical protein
VDRETPLRRYRELVLDELPRRARAQGWVVVHDHCLGRIVLDNTLGGRWYDVLDRRRSPAFAQLDDVRLAAAVALAERIAAEGDALLRELDARSLAWRGKAPRRPGGDDRPWPVPPTRTPPRSPASRGPCAAAPRPPRRPA